MANHLDEALSALADPTRRRVVELLRERPRRAGELAVASGLSRPAMSKHLRVLRTSGLVEEEHSGPDARVRTYHLRPEPFAMLEAWLADVQRSWSDQLDAFKDYAERSRGGEAS